MRPTPGSQEGFPRKAGNLLHYRATQRVRCWVGRPHRATVPQLLNPDGVSMARLRTTRAGRSFPTSQKW